MRQRLERVEKTVVKLDSENTVLWRELIQSRERQANMKRRLRKIMTFVYKLVNNAKNRKALEAAKASGVMIEDITPVTPSPSTGHGDGFKDLLSIGDVRLSFDFVFFN